MGGILLLETHYYNANIYDSIIHIYNGDSRFSQDHKRLIFHTCHYWNLYHVLEITSVGE